MCSGFVCIFNLVLRLRLCNNFYFILYFAYTFCILAPTNTRTAIQRALFVAAYGWQADKSQRIAARLHIDRSIIVACGGRSLPAAGRCCVSGSNPISIIYIINRHLCIGCVCNFWLIRK